MKRRLTDFCQDQRGSIAIIFSATLVVMLFAAGLAFDYARSASTAATMQDDVDATLLFVARAKQAAGEREFDAQAAAAKHLKTLQRQRHSQAKAKISVTEVSPGRYKAKAVLNVPTTLLKLLGHTHIATSIGSEVTVGDQPVEVALVLDNTASMAGVKLDALKSASKSLIDTVYTAERADQNVRLSLVPFAQYVNVGQSRRNASWMNVELDSSRTLAEVCYENTPVTGQSNCRTETGTSTNDGVPYTYTYQVCDYQYGPPEQVCYTPTETKTWYGCAGSRNYPLETTDADYDTTPIPGVMNVSCPSEIAPLTNDRAALEQQIDNMIATGETYIPSGLIWGWRTLSKTEPFEEARGYDEAVAGQMVRKYLVLMSDGKNTLSPVYPEHTGNDTALSDKLTLEICSNMKAKGIEIYTVAFEVPDAGAKQVLQSCASTSSKFFDAGNGQELDEAFRKIAQDFNPLRLTR